MRLEIIHAEPVEASKDSFSYKTIFLFVYAAVRRSTKKYACPRLRQGYAGLRILPIVRRNLVKTDGPTRPQRPAGLSTLIYQALIAQRRFDQAISLSEIILLFFYCGKGRIIRCFTVGLCDRFKREAMGREVRP